MGAAFVPLFPLEQRQVRVLLLLTSSSSSPPPPYPPHKLFLRSLENWRRGQDFEENGSRICSSISSRAASSRHAQAAVLLLLLLLLLVRHTSLEH